MYNTFIFDIDGTLINTEQAVLKSLQKILEYKYNLDKNYHLCLVFRELFLWGGSVSKT